MAEARDEAVPQWEPLPRDCPVYRAALNWNAIDKVSKEFVRGAFIRREPREDGTPRDEHGISVYVFREEGYSEEQIVELIRADYDPCRGVGRLFVGPIRDIETTPRLDVVQDRKNHANIEGLPAHGKNIPKAERLATLLAKLTKRLWPDPA